MNGRHSWWFDRYSCPSRLVPCESEDAVTINISMALRWIANIVVGIAYLFFVSWKLTLVMLSVVPLVAIGAIVYGKKVSTHLCHPPIPPYPHTTIPHTAQLTHRALAHCRVSPVTARAGCDGGARRNTSLDCASGAMACGGWSAAEQTVVCVQSTIVPLVRTVHVVYSPSAAE